MSLLCQRRLRQPSLQRPRYTLTATSYKAAQTPRTQTLHATTTSHTPAGQVARASQEPNPPFLLQQAHRSSQHRIATAQLLHTRCNALALGDGAHMEVISHFNVSGLFSLFSACFG